MEWGFTESFVLTGALVWLLVGIAKKMFPQLVRPPWSKKLLPALPGLLGLAIGTALLREDGRSWHRAIAYSVLAGLCAQWCFILFKAVYDGLLRKLGGTPPPTAPGV